LCTDEFYANQLQTGKKDCEKQDLIAKIADSTSPIKALAEAIEIPKPRLRRCRFS